jgi:hypothetical protein
MKQTTIQFDKRRRELVTIQRLQQAVDLIATGTMMSEAMRAQGLSPGFGKFLESARILARINHKTVVVLKPQLERKDYYRVMELQKKYHQKSNAKRVSIPKADTDMLGLVNMPKIESKRNYKPRVKKAVALPWWKRILLYLANQ